MFRIILLSIFSIFGQSVYGASLTSKFCGMYIIIFCYIIIFKLNLFYINTDLKDCESYTSTEYKYSIYHELFTSMENITSNEFILDLKIYAIAQKDVYILLTPTTDITNETVFYELGMN